MLLRSEPQKEIDWQSFADDILQNADNQPVLAITAPQESETDAAFRAVSKFFRNAMTQGPEKASKKVPTDFEVPAFQAVLVLYQQGAFGYALLDAILQATYKEDDTHYKKVSVDLLQIIDMAVIDPLSSNWVDRLKAACQTHGKSLPPPYSAAPSAPLYSAAPSAPPAPSKDPSAPASAPVSAGSRPLKS